MSWGVFPDGRTGLSSLFDPLLESFVRPSLESSSLSLSYLQLTVKATATGNKYVTTCVNLVSRKLSLWRSSVWGPMRYNTIHSQRRILTEKPEISVLF